MNNDNNNGFVLMKKNLPYVNQFYRNTLSETEKQWYDRLVKCIIAFRSEVSIKDVSMNQIETIFNCIRLDHPLFFYVESIQLVFESISRKAIIKPKYRFDRHKTNSTILAVLGNIKKIISQLNTSDEYKKEIFIHDYLCKNNYYDNSFVASSYECVGPLVFGKGVCEGISKAVKLLCDYLGIYCIVIHGNARQTNKSLGNEAHTWNIIKINNSFYHLDITFDLTIGSGTVLRYDYFNLSDYEIRTDHNYINDFLPNCSDMNCFYYKNNQTVSNYNDLKSFIHKQIALLNRHIVIKLMFQINQEMIEKALNSVFSGRVFFVQGYQYSFNEYQNVLQVDLL